jgi:hypothetical protein
MSTNPFAATLLNNDGALKPKPHVDVKPRPAQMATPYCSQIDAPQSNYSPPVDIRPREVEVGSLPCCSAIAAPTENHQQPDTEQKSKPEVAPQPVYLELVKRDELGPAANPTSIYIPSGSNATDPTAIRSAPICPVDGSVMRPVGSTRLAWICVAYGHQFDVVNGMATVPMIYVADDKLHPALPNTVPSL